MICACSGIQCSAINAGLFRLLDLLLGVVDVAQRVHEQVIHRFDVFGKEAHGEDSVLVVFGGNAGARTLGLKPHLMSERGA
jgi:hypothetical protein